MPGPRRWRWRGRLHGRGRPPAPVYLYNLPTPTLYTPTRLQGGCPPQAVVLTAPELEAMRLVDYLDKTYEEAARLMGTSRSTVWRLTTSARKKIAEALTTGRPLCISYGGEIEPEPQNE